jgi:hypothetical protein
MGKWKKVGYFADGVVYAHGNRRKVVLHHSPDVYFELDTKKVWWAQGTRHPEPVKSGKDK